MEMTNDELVEEINKYSTGSKQLNNILRHQHVKLYDEMMRRTKFLDEEYSLQQIYIDIRLYSLKNNLSSIPKCSNPNCTNKVHWNRRKNEFSKYCCHHCKYSDQNNKEVVEQENKKREQTNIREFGYTHPMKSKECKKKALNTFINNYNTSNPMSLDSVKNKRKETCMKLYGGVGLQSKSMK